MIFPRVLIITSRDDFAADYLILRIKEAKINYLRLNSEDICNWSIKYDPIRSILLHYNDYEYNLEKVTGIYFRRAPNNFVHFSNQDNTPFLWRESKEFLEGIYLTLKGRWINPLFETFRAERKMFQLNLAVQLGLKTPRTIVSNNPKVIQEFIDQYDAIIKPISHGILINNKDTYAIYTNELPKGMVFDQNSLFETPLFLQQKIQNLADIRLTIIGNKVFPVAIRKEGDDVDWRRQEIRKNYELVKIPEDIVQKCLLLNKRLGLVYSAIDLIESGDKEYVFLEVNPAGEWVWLERELNIQLSDTLIEELIRL